MAHTRVIDDGLSTALIIEDDADWDINIKKQLQDLASKIRTFSTPEKHSARQNESQSPYGDSWDILWIGSCAVPAAPPNTETIPGEGQEWPDQMHMVFWAHGGLACIFGYVVNSRSARSLFGWMLDLDCPADLHLGHYCETHDCIAVWPPLIHSHVPAGPTLKESNIRTKFENETREQGETRYIVNSAILNTLEKVGHGGKQTR